MENQQANEMILASLMARLVPLDALPKPALRELANHLRPQPCPAGRELPLGNIRKHLYLLRGQVTVLHDGQPLTMVNGGTPEARYALNRKPSPKLSVKTESDSLFLLVDMVQARQFARPKEPPPGPDRRRRPKWLEQLLEKPIFRRLPQKNLRKVLNNVEPIKPEEGAHVLRQGQMDDHYYIIQQGQCSVTRSKDDNVQHIDNLEVGDTFGAITLLSEHPSFVNTVMDQPGQILRMDKNDFHEWVSEPLTKTLDYRRAAQLSKKGAIWLDVRCAEEYHAGHLPNSIHIPLQHLNIPFSTLIKLIRGLDDKRPYMVYSNTQKRSGAASFRFMEQDLNAMLLEGGVEGLPEGHLTDISTAKLMRQQKEEELRRARLQQQRRQVAARRQPEEDAQTPSSADAMLEQAKAEIERLKEKRRLAMITPQVQQQNLEEAMRKIEQPENAPPPHPTEPEAVAVGNRWESQRPLAIAAGILVLLGAIGFFAVSLISDYFDSAPNATTQTSMTREPVAISAETPVEELEVEPAVVAVPEATESSSDGETPPVEEVSETAEETSTEPTAQTFAYTPIRTFRDRLNRLGKEGPEMVELPGGTFLMGASAHRPYSDELPQVAVELTPFSIGKYEITFAEYRLFAEDSDRIVPDDRGWGEDRQPVINVTWRDAKQYSQWLSEQTGHNYRLPSEREWEYAASVGTNTLYWWGGKMRPEAINCGDCSSQWSGKQPAPVGSFPANPLGLHDLLGNVMEWTEVCQHMNYFDAPRTGNVWYGGVCHRRMVRGGSYRRYSQEIRTTKRTSYPPSARSDELGFRVVRVK